MNNIVHCSQRRFAVWEAGRIIFYLGHVAVRSNRPIHSDQQMTAQRASEQALMEAADLAESNQS